MISSDKAKANKHNGRFKRLSEIIVQAFANDAQINSLNKKIRKRVSLWLDLEMFLVPQAQQFQFSLSKLALEAQSLLHIPK